MHSRSRKSVLTMYLGLCLSACASLETMTDNEMFLYGVNHLDSAKGVVAIETCAEAGHGGCAQVLGDLYYKGQGVEKNLDKARYWQMQAMDSDYDYHFSGIFAALSLARYYCEDASYQVSTDKIVKLLNATQGLLDSDLAELSESGKAEAAGFSHRITAEIERLKQQALNGECALAS